MHAQSTPLPQVYSLTVSAGTTTINVARDGSKVSLEQIVPKSDRGPGMHIRQIYDFATHKYWTMPEGEPCIVSTYTSNSLPSMFDPIGGAEEMRAEMAKSKPVALRSETVNGIPTKVYEMPVPEIKGKMRMFLEEKHNFVVKSVIIAAGGKEQTQMEITNLSYEKPAAALLVPPQNCRVQAGESGATGGRAETQIDASAKGEANLGTAKPAQKGGAAAAAGDRGSRRRCLSCELHWSGPGGFRVPVRHRGERSRAGAVGARQPGGYRVGVGQDHLQGGRKADPEGAGEDRCRQRHALGRQGPPRDRRRRQEDLVTDAGHIRGLQAQVDALKCGARGGPPRRTPS